MILEIEQKLQLFLKKSSESTSISKSSALFMNLAIVLFFKLSLLRRFCKRFYNFYSQTNFNKFITFLFSIAKKM